MHYVPKSILIAVSFGIPLIAAQAGAQGFFDFFGNGWRQQFPPAYAPPPEFRGGESVPPRRAEPRGGNAYCVRLCDGFYFPLTPTSGSDANAQCQSLCPNTKTKVFRGSSEKMEDTIASDGSRYAKLQNAFLYRRQKVEACGCKPNGASGVANVDPASDQTLRQGDIIVTAAGATVFEGARSRGKAQFTALRNGRNMPADLQKQLAANVPSTEQKSTGQKSAGAIARGY